MNTSRLHKLIIFIENLYSVIDLSKYSVSHSLVKIQGVGLRTTTQLFDMAKAQM